MGENKIYRPWLIAGGGRSGTSTFARILHEYMGVRMGYEFVPSDKYNPTGYYEDQDMNALDLSYWSDMKLSRYYYMGLLAGQLRRRLDDGIPWGVKNPWLQFSIGYYMHILWDLYKIRPIVVEPVRSLYRREQSLIKMKINPNWGKMEPITLYNVLTLRLETFQQNMRAYPDVHVHEYIIGEERVSDLAIQDWLQEVADVEGAFQPREGTQESGGASAQGTEEGRSKGGGQ